MTAADPWLDEQIRPDGLVLTARVAALHAAVQSVATARDHVVRDVLTEAARYERWLLRDVTTSQES